MKTKRVFSNEFKREVVMELLSNGTTAAQICRKHQITAGTLYHWKKRFERGKFGNEPTADGALKERISELERLVGKLTFENEVLKRAREFFLEQARKKASSLPLMVSKDDLSKNSAKS